MSHEAANKTVAQLSSTEPAQPVDANCCTTTIGGVQMFGLCNNSSLAQCTFRRTYGYSHLCTHPDWKQYVASNRPLEG